MRSAIAIWVGIAVWAAPGEGYVGQWHSFTNKERVTSLILYQGVVYAGTQGGVRAVDPVTLQQHEYNNLDGLLDPWIVGWAAPGDGSLWAVSQSGYVSRLDGNHWDSYGQSYAAEQWTMNDRAVLGAGDFLYLGSTQGLTLFDVGQKVAQLNLTRLANQNGVSVLSLLRRGDTLYAGTAQGVFKTAVDFSHPLNPAAGYGNLADPNIWIPVVFPGDSAGAPARAYNTLAFFGDSLATFGPGTVLTQPVFLAALLGSSLQIGSRVFAPAFADAAVMAGSRVFAGGPGALAYRDTADASTAWTTLKPLRVFPLDTVANVTAYGNTVWTQSLWGVERLHPSDSGFYFDTTGIVAPSIELFTRALKNMASDTNGDAYIGTWGTGLWRLRGTETRVWNQQTDPCIYDVVQNFPVVYAVSNVHQNGLFFSMFKAELIDNNQLDYLNTSTGQVSCLDSNSDGGYPHVDRVFSDSLLGVGSERGVEFYKIRQGPSAPLLTSLGLWSLSGESLTAWDMAPDPTGRPWVLIGGQLAYADSVGNPDYSGANQFTPVTDFPGTDCQVMRSDPLGAFWIGCTNGLFHVVPGATDISHFERYGLNDGLLSPVIYDLSVNPVNGQVWVTTDRGVNVLESKSQPVVTALQGVRVYPNPFLPQHRFVIFDGLPPDATVRIHTPAGNVIRTLRPSQLQGNQAQWDGTNEDGRAVSPGVYLYSVASGSSVARGKIIVAR